MNTITSKTNSEKSDHKIYIRLRYFSWTVYFIVNLPLSLYLGIMSTTGPARGGIFVAIVLLWSFGIYCAMQFDHLSRALHLGTWLTALLQFYPFPHIIFGSVAIHYAAFFNIDPTAKSETLDTFLSGFVATMITGSGMLTLALMSGSCLLLIALFAKKKVDI